MASDQIMKRKRAYQYHALGFFCVMLLIKKSSATEFLVGGNGHWAAASSTDNSTANYYAQWAERSRFQVGDSLVFNYQSGQDSVLEVTEAAYTNCSTTTPPMANFTNGHTVFTFNRSGAFYFISGNKDSCLKNEKLVVIVLADRTQNHSNQTNSSPPPSSSSTPSPAPTPAGEDPPPTGTVEINPTPAPESPRNAASSTSIGPAGSIIGAVFAASSVILAL